jgi:hypothetical protein
MKQKHPCGGELHSFYSRRIKYAKVILVMCFESAVYCTESVVCEINVSIEQWWIDNWLYPAVPMDVPGGTELGKTGSWAGRHTYNNLHVKRTGVY